MNVMRTPAMQTLFLYASTLEANNDFTRVLCDQWLEITFEDSETAQSMISSILLLRNARDLLLQLTLQGISTIKSNFSSKNFQFIDLNKSIDVELVSKPKTYELQRLLSIKMIEFLESSALYAIRRVLPGRFHDYCMLTFTFNYLAELDTIYRRNHDEDDVEENVNDSDANGENVKINEYLTYNWFVDERIIIQDFSSIISLRSNDDQESFWSEYAGSTMQKHWICPYCNEDILVTVAERIAHENQCQLNCK